MNLKCRLEENERRLEVVESWRLKIEKAEGEFRNEIQILRIKIANKEAAQNGN